VEAKFLQRVAQTIVAAAGSSASEAQTVAEHLVRANLTGHDSHGVGMLPMYVRLAQQKVLIPDAPLRTVRDDGAMLAFDGGRGYGQRIAREAMDAAIERCRSTGVVVAAIGNAHHVGRVGTYAEQAVAAGLVSLHFANVTDHPPLVAPYRGSGARFGTNPVCIAVPGTKDTPPVILDMATSKRALGKMRVAKNRGEEVDAGLLIDHHGQPTQDPGVMFGDGDRGALLPMGEHKGYGLLVMCELLAGVLTGGWTIQPGHERLGGIVNHMLTVILDPSRLVERPQMQREFDAFVAYTKASDPTDPGEPVLVPGDPERASESRRKREGIPLDDTTWEEILQAADSVGLVRHNLRDTNS